MFAATVCQVCGKAFQGRIKGGKAAKYCSLQCCGRAKLAVGTRACRTCGETKPSDMFPAGRRQRRKCRIEHYRKWVAAKPLEWHEKERERHRLKAGRGKEHMAEYQRGRVPQNSAAVSAWYHRNEGAKAAHCRVHKAIAIGTIKREPCSVCGSALSECHHEDYAKPLDVMWMCHKCHKGFHAEKRRLQRLLDAKRRRECVVVLF